MNTGTKIGAAVLGGYLLGRRRKAKLALAFGGWMVGKKLNLDPKALAAQLGKEVQSSPEFGELRNQLRNEVVTVGRTAASDLIAAQTNRLADTLHERTESLKGATAQAESDERGGDLGAEAEQSVSEESGEPTTGEQGEDKDKSGEAEQPTRSKTARPKRPASPKKPATGGQKTTGARSSSRSSSRESGRTRSSGETSSQEGRRSDRG